MPSTPSFLKAEISAESLKRLVPKRSPSERKPSRRSRSAATLVGLDIQPGHVSAVQARVNGSVVVQRAVGAALPSGAVRDGEVLDVQALSETLRELFSHARLDKRVRVGVANQRTVLRMLEMPPIPAGKELETAVRFQAEDQIPMPLESAVLDHQTLGPIETPGGPRQRVVVVAAQKSMVERLLEAVRGAGLRPEAVDLSAFALIRALHRPAEQQQGRVLYLNVGGLTNMAIAEGTTCRFTRVAAGGLESMAGHIAERNGIPLDRARQLLHAIDLSVPAAPVADAPAADQSSPGDEASDRQEPGDGPVPAAVEPVPAREAEIDVRPVLAAGVREIAGEVRNSLEFHRSQEGGGEVSTVVLSGAALQIGGFADALRGELAVPVHTRTVALGDGAVLEAVSPERLAIAAGLAVEEAPR